MLVYVCVYIYPSSILKWCTFTCLRSIIVCKGRNWVLYMYVRACVYMYVCMYVHSILRWCIQTRNWVVLSRVCRFIVTKLKNFGFGSRIAVNPKGFNLHPRWGLGKRGRQQRQKRWETHVAPKKRCQCMQWSLVDIKHVWEASSLQCKKEQDCRFFGSKKQ